MREVFRTDFAKRVLDARNELGISQPELARRAEVSQSSVGEAETSARGSTYVASLAKALQVDAYWLEIGRGSRKIKTAPPPAPSASR